MDACNAQTKRIKNVISKSHCHVTRQTKSTQIAYVKSDRNSVQGENVYNIQLMNG